jgi:hypothetical protein
MAITLESKSGNGSPRLESAQLRSQARQPGLGSGASSSSNSRPEPVIIGRQQISEPTAEPTVELQDVVVQLPEEALEQLNNLLNQRNEDLCPRWPRLEFFKECIEALHHKDGLIDSITHEKFSPSSNVIVSENAFVREGINNKESKEIWDALKLNGFLDQEGKIVLDENGQPKEITASKLNFIQENFRDHVVSTLQQLSNYFLLNAVMISHPNENGATHPNEKGATVYHGPYAIKSIQDLINQQMQNCPNCRGPIKNIVSFKDYLLKIKEDINNYIKDSDNKHQLKLLVDQLIDQCDLSKNEDVNKINESLQRPLLEQPSQATDDFFRNLGISLGLDSDSDDPTEDRLSLEDRFSLEDRLSLFMLICIETICHSAIFVDANSDQSQSQTALASLLVAASAIRTLGGFCLSSNRNNSLVIGWLAESMIFSSTIGILANSWEEHGIFPWQNGFNRPYIVYAFLRGALDFVCLCLLCCQCD